MFFPIKIFINKNTKKLSFYHPMNYFFINFYDKIMIDFLFTKYHEIGLLNIKG